jgi:hypothetical protein
LREKARMRGDLKEFFLCLFSLTPTLQQERELFS